MNDDFDHLAAIEAINEAGASLTAPPATEPQAAPSEPVARCIEWIRNHYQDHPNIDSLCAAMRWDLLPRLSADGGKDIPLAAPPPPAAPVVAVEPLRTLIERLIESALDSDASGRPDAALAQLALELRASLAAPAQPAPQRQEDASEFCWLVELFLPDGGNSLGFYHTGFTDLGGESRATKDPHQAKRYSKAEAEAVATKLGFTLQGVWRAVEHGFSAPQRQEDASDA